MAKAKTVKLKLDEVNFNIPDDGVNYKVYASKSNTKITDSIGNDSLYGGAGNDTLIAGKGDDLLSGGKGINSLQINGASTGKDTIVLGKGTDNLSFDKSDTFSYSKSGNNLVINHKQGSTETGEVIVKNYFKSAEGTASLKTLNANDLNTLINTAGLTLNDTKSKKITGTYLNDIITADGNVKNTITTGKGNDTINAGLANDTITIDGKGEKNIKIKKGDGDDTIAFKGDGLKATTTIEFDYDQGSATFAEYTYEKKGNNLLIHRSWEGEGDKEIVETTTIKDYFKYNPKISILTHEGDVAESLSSILATESFELKGSTNKSNTIIGSNFDDEITGGKKADKISTGYGTDFVEAGGGADKITINGAGDKEIVIGRNDGNDTIILDLDNVKVDGKININITLDDVYGEAADTTFKIAANKQDVLIINAYEMAEEDVEDSDKVIVHKALTQTITIKNYFNNADKVKLMVDGGSDIYKLLPKDQDEVETIGNKTYGTPFDDSITGTDKNNIIYAYAGNDTITATKGNDKIYSTGGNNRYIYDKFVDECDPTSMYGTVNTEQNSLGHDTIISTGGNDTISFSNLGVMEKANFFEPNIIYWNDRVYPSYTENAAFAHLCYKKSGNDLILGGYSNIKSNDVNTITLKDYFKYEKGEYGVKYIDNGALDESGNPTASYEILNILDNASLQFDGNETPNLISFTKGNNFTGTFMNDYIRGNSKPDVLRGGDGNDTIHGFGSHTKKDNLYGDAGNDVIFTDNANAYGGVGNDIFVSDFTEGADILYDEAGYDRLSLRNRQYLTYFDVSLKGENDYVIGDDIYIKDIMADADPVREPYKSSQVLDLDENGELKFYDDWEHDGENYDKPIYKTVSGEVDQVIARYVGRPTFEVSESYYARLQTEGPELLEKWSDYDGVDTSGRVNKRYLDGYALENYVPREGYKLVYCDWDFWVKDSQYYNQGFETTPLDIYDNPETPNGDKVYKNIYNTISMYDEEDSLISTATENIPLYTVVTDEEGVEHRVPATYVTDEDGNKQLVPITDPSTQEQAVYPYVKNLYNPSFDEMELTGKRAILQNKDMGVVIKNGTHKENAIETITLDRDTYDTTRMPGKIENLMIGDYNQGNIESVASSVANWLKESKKYTSVQDAINRASKAELDKMFALFENTYNWTTDVKYLSQGYTAGKIEGTAIIEDNQGITSLTNDDNSRYEMTLKKEGSNEHARMSMLSDYAGDDLLILDNNAAGYSFLFDVEVDEDGKLLNYSRDFYVKFKGEEANNTGLQIMNGRDAKHAIETIQMKPVGEGANSTIFTYNQNTIDAVRQEVASWLVNNDYLSVQDVLHSEKQADVTALIAQFAPINTQA